MTQLNLHNIVEFSIYTRKHGTFNTHNIITVDDRGVHAEVSIYTNDGKELIRSMNGKSIEVRS